ncbi:HlyD family secretion protein [Flaviaesturariibacter terrae]
MKKTPRNLLLATLLLAACGAAAQPARPKAPEAAPTPPATERKIRNFDDVEAELNRVQKQLDEMQESRLPAPPPPPRIDFAETRRELDRADKELARTHELSARQLEDARRQMARARQEMARVEADLPRIQAEAARSRETARQSMAEAKLRMAEARAEIKSYREFEDALVTAGLISRDHYTIEHRDGKLFIDGKEQPASVYEKHRAFLDKHKRFTWKKSDDEFQINDHD